MTVAMDGAAEGAVEGKGGLQRTLASGPPGSRAHGAQGPDSGVHGREPGAGAGAGAGPRSGAIGVRRSGILSGDTLVRDLAASLGPQYVVFLVGMGWVWGGYGAGMGGEGIGEDRGGHRSVAKTRACQPGAGQQSNTEECMWRGMATSGLLGPRAWWRLRGSGVWWPSGILGYFILGDAARGCQACAHVHGPGMGPPQQGWLRGLRRRAARHAVVAAVAVAGAGAPPPPARPHPVPYRPTWMAFMTGRPRRRARGCCGELWCSRVGRHGGVGWGAGTGGRTGTRHGRGKL